MKQLIISMLIAISILPEVFSQESDCAVCPMRFATKTETNFNATWINSRHIVRLKKGEKLIIEMLDLKDYDLLANIDSLLSAVRNDLRDLKDSMQTQPSGNLRIDYVTSTNKDFKKIRIQKYASKGDIYLKKNGEMSRLKTEQDTLRILIQKYKEGLTKKYEPVQLTLLLNNYSDLDQMMVLNPDLQRYIDTMRNVSLPEGKKVNPYVYQTSILFDPYLSTEDHYTKRFKIIKGELVKNEYAMNVKPSNLPIIDLNLYLGIGVVRNLLSPTADIGLDYVFPGTRNTSFQTFLGIYAGPYLSFENRGDGKYATYSNWFINAELGSNTKGQTRYSDAKPPFLRASLGVGYLVNPDNIIFHGTTLKAFFNYTFKNNISVSPELIATDNFHSVFPGITVKYYLNAFGDY